MILTNMRLKINLYLNELSDDGIRTFSFPLFGANGEL